MSTSATRISAILSMKRKAHISNNILEKILKRVPELEEQNRRKAEQNFKNKMNREGFIQLNGNIWYRTPISKNVINLYIKNQGYKSNKNVKKNVKKNLKIAIGVHNSSTKEETAGRAASAKFLKTQLKNMVNELREKNIFRPASVKRK